MKQLLFTFLLFFSAGVCAEKIFTSCLSESRMSRYDLNFDIQTNKGTIRYRYMKQDTTYDALIYEIFNSKIKGVAHFSSSRTGDTKGNSFEFIYDYSNNLFTEVNIKANCINAVIDN